MGAIILAAISFFLIGMIVAYKIMSYKKTSEKIGIMLEKVDRLWKKDNPNQKPGELYYPNIEFKTECEIIDELINPNNVPVMDVGSVTQGNAQIIGWLIDKIKADPMKWYNNYTI